MNSVVGAYGIVQENVSKLYVQNQLANVAFDH